MHCLPTKIKLQAATVNCHKDTSFKKHCFLFCHIQVLDFLKSKTSCSKLITFFLFVLVEFYADAYEERKGKTTFVKLLLNLRVFMQSLKPQSETEASIL